LRLPIFRISNRDGHVINVAQVKEIEPAIRACSPGFYWIDQIELELLPCGSSNRRWGIAIKEDDGSFLIDPVYREWELTSNEFEEIVRDWIEKKIGVDGSQITEISYLDEIEAPDGTCEVEVLVTLTLLQGMRIIVLVVCKQQNGPVRRDEIEMLESKLRDVRANKGIVISTSGFQSGAVEYARARGIATVAMDMMAVRIFRILTNRFVTERS
jgi:hypothetical protein